MEPSKLAELRKTAARMRRVALETVQTAGSGHIGGSFSAIEILTTLYFDALNVRPDEPRWEDRDRFVMSKGHCTPALYTCLAMRGYFPEARLGDFRRIDANMSGHAEMRHVPGVDMSTGSLGQGFSVALGMAISAKMFRRDYHVFALLGDGEIQEGQVWEAAMAAGAKEIDNLTAIIDNNGLQLDGTLEEVLDPQPIDEKFRAFRWNVLTVDGHDISALSEALRAARAFRGRPTAIIAKTVKGKGVSFMENDVHWHGAHPSPEQFVRAFAELDQAIAEV